VSRAAGIVLAAVFAWSGIAKLVRRPDLTALGLPPQTWWVVSFVELDLAVALVVAPSIGGLLAMALLAGFTTFLLARRNSGAGCGCFGSAKAAPISSVDFVRNAALFVVAVVAAFG
jgi:hypothetical protein